MRRFASTVAVLFALSASAANLPELTRPDFPEGNAVREIRAAVVCYGGVSLAIYMYGNVRELHHLALASSALECDAGGDGAFCGGVKPLTAFDALPESAKPYYKALVELWDRDKVRPRFVIDIVSGTSAGGINGIFLAKALAHNRRIDGLREIWFREADIGRLAGWPWQVRAASRLLLKRAALGGNGWLKQLYLALEEMDRPEKQGSPALPSLLWLEQPIELRVTATDFYGTERLLEVGDPPTVSELRYDHVFPFAAFRGSDGVVRGREGAMSSSSDFMNAKNADGSVDVLNNVALAYAARSSASFPVAFPAMPLDELKKALGQEKLNTAALADKYFGARKFDLETATGTDFAAHLFLVDGGVLNNYPFSIAYQRVSRRSPKFQTRRVFIYLEPDPRVPRDLTAFRGQSNPNAFQMLVRAKSTIPGAQPIAQDLQQIQQHNQRVARIGEIIRKDEIAAQQEKPEGNYEEKAIEAECQADDGSVARRVECVMRSNLTPKGLSQRFSASGLSEDELRQQVKDMRNLVEQRAATSGDPLMEEAYVRLRVHSVLDQFSRVMGRAVCAVPDDYDGPRTALMRAIVMEWARLQKLTGASVDVDRRTAFLNAFDLGYLRRKLRFVDDWLNLQYDPKKVSDDEPNYGLSRDKLQAAQRVVANHVQKITECVRGQGECVGTLKIEDEIKRVRPFVCVPVARNPSVQAEAMLDPEANETEPAKQKALENQKALNDLAAALETAFLDFQEKGLAALYKDFERETGRWKNDDAARAVLARYLGFPYWDRVSYPYTAFSGVGDLANIELVRMSPSDTLLLTDKGAAKLAGEAIGHFGAFFSRDGRERDYLWGRLDGSQRLLDLLGFRTEGSDEQLARDLMGYIMHEETKDGAVAKANLEFMEACRNDPDKCVKKKKGGA